MMEKEARTNKAGADLDKRNRNWQKINTHLAESAKKHIHSSGENWIRFDDGTQECTLRVVVDRRSQHYTTKYDMLSGAFDLPKSFVKLTSATASPIFKSGYPNLKELNTPFVPGDIKTSGTIRFVTKTEFPVGTSVEVFLTLTGRWK